MTSGKSISRAKLVGYLDEYLKITAIPDRSVNGLQVEGTSRVVRAAFAVDACLETIRAAARRKADILVVHHGILWGRNERITGVMRNRIAKLIESGMSLYAAHLPLDCHEDVGNNAQMARLLGFELGVRFADYHGVQIGYIAKTKRELSREELVRKVERILKTRPEVLTFGPSRIRRIGIVSGEAAGFAAEARDLGCDTFVTGETSHTAYHLAKEARINVIYGGHYATETLGVKALAGHLRKEFSLDCRFITAPTGY